MSTIIDGTAGMTAPQGAVYNGLATATVQNSTSGTAIDFTSIPLWVKRVTVMFNAVSTSGSSTVLIQLGSGSVTTSGYASTAWVGGSTNTGSISTAGFIVDASGSSAFSRAGIVIFTNLTSNTWVSFGNINQVSTVVAAFTGTVSLSGTLDRVRITTTNGTDTFDAGSINIMWE
jgi:hypothetical protein